MDISIVDNRIVNNSSIAFSMTHFHKTLFKLRSGLAIVLALVGNTSSASAQSRKLEPVDVEGQPLGANVVRLLDALQFLGAPLPEGTADALRTASKARDARAIQQLLDPHVLLTVTLNPESRVKVSRGTGPTTLQQ